MQVREIFALGVCLVGFVVMIVFPFWAPRSFQPTYEKALRQPAGKRLLAWLVAEFEIMFLGGILQMADYAFWPYNQAPLIIPALAFMWLLGGVIGALWTAHKLIELQKFG